MKRANDVNKYEFESDITFWITGCCLTVPAKMIRQLQTAFWLWLSANCLAVTDNAQLNCHFNTSKPRMRQVHCLSISADHNWVNGCGSWIPLRPRGAFTGTFPKESYLKPSQCSWRSHTQWTYGQSPIVCCAIYGSVACHLFCSSETSMTPVWILNKRLFLCLGEGCCHLIFLTNYWYCAFLMRLTVLFLFLLMEIWAHNDCQVSFQKSKNQRIVEASMCIWALIKAMLHFLFTHWQHTLAQF